MAEIGALTPGTCTIVLVRDRSNVNERVNKKCINSVVSKNDFARIAHFYDCFIFSSL